MNEKGALRQIDRMEIHPEDFEKRVCECYLQLTTGKADAALIMLDSIHAKIEVLSADAS